MKAQPALSDMSRESYKARAIARKRSKETIAFLSALKNGLTLADLDLTQRLTSAVAGKKL